MIQFLGRLHIVFLHLPIGILLLAFLLELCAARKWLSVERKTLTFVYGVGSISALFTCISGYLLSLDGSYGEGLVDKHMWAGISVAFLAFVALVFSNMDHKLTFFTSVLLLISIIFAGHLGGSITHGENFLWSSVEKEELSYPIFNVDDVATAKVYQDIVQPILQARCVYCHGPDKRKGKLRMDTPAHLASAGKSGKPLIGVEAENSILYQRMMLPLSDEEHMPPIEKPQPTSEEIAMLQWWLDNNSKIDQSIQELAENDTMIYALVDSLISQEYAMHNSQNQEESVVPANLPPANLKNVTDDQLSSLKAMNIVALPTGKNSPFLEVNMVNVQEMKEEHWQMLEVISKHIVRLKFSDKNIGNEDLKYIQVMDNLMYLHLDNTQISDTGLEIINTLPHLSYLNLSGTDVSNAGILKLSNAPKLKTIYAYKSKVTDMQKLPANIQVIIGDYTLPVLTSDTTRVGG